MLLLQMQNSDCIEGLALSEHGTRCWLVNYADEESDREAMKLDLRLHS